MFLRSSWRRADNGGRLPESSNFRHPIIDDEIIRVIETGLFGICVCDYEVA